ncbi:MAG: glycosyltransferase family 2 protein [Beijerinckiaceae bacterium]
MQLIPNPVRRALARFRAARARDRYRAHIADVLRRAGELAAAEQRTSPRPIENGRIVLSIVVPTWNTKTRYLLDLIGSFRRQSTPECELILTDDGSTDKETLAFIGALDESGITVVLNAENRGISAASNAGIAAAKGQWITFMDHDDALAPGALDRILRALVSNPSCRLLYTDEVVTDGALTPEEIFLKPAWDPVLLSGVNYVNHLTVYRAERVRELGGFRLGFEGSQDYDLLLRYTDGLKPKEILHLPYPAYLWRRDGASYSVRFLERATDNARRAIKERYRGVEVEGAAIIPDLHRVRFDQFRTSWPSVSCIIPSLESPELIRKVLAGLLNGTDYPDLEVIVIDNGSTSPETLAVYETFQKASPKLRISIRPEPFNFAAAINRGVAMAKGEVLLLLNNDIEIIDPFWLKEMVSCLDFGDVGVVGAKLLYPDRTAQHLGVIVGFGGFAGHWYMNQPETFPGPMGRLAVRQSLSAVTGACMLVSRTCWDATGPLDETRFRIAYNDIDFCLRARAKGFRIVWTPFATLIHHESATRGSDETPQNKARFEREKEELKALHGTDKFEDPAVNPWLTKDRSYPEARLLNALPPAR